MIVEELKKSIYDCAMMGKLTIQLSEDSPIENIYQFLKFDSNLSSIKEDEIPFEIPKNWRWERLGNLGETADTLSFSDGPFGSNLKTQHYILEPEVRIIQLSNIGENGWVDENVKYTSFSHLKTISRCEVKAGDFAIAKMMPAGRPVIIPNLGTKIVLGSDAVKFVPNKVLNKKYLYYCLKSPMFLKQVYSEVHGITRVRTSLNKLKTYLIPIPPIEEQQRIVDRISEIFDKLDKISPIEVELRELKNNFPNDMKKSILNEAFIGNLVNNNLESDDVFKLEEIIKSNNKKYIPINSDVLPPTWKFFKFGDLFEIINGFTPLRSNEEFWNKKEIPWFTVDDINAQGRVINYTNQFITKKALGKNSKRLLPADTILLCCTASVGEYAITKIPLTTNQQFNGLIVKEELKEFILPMYLYEFVKTLKTKLLSKSGKTTFSFLSTKKLAEFEIPIPPIEEQQRIIDKIESLLPLCDDIETLIIGE